MIRKLGLLLIAVVLVFSSAFDVVYDDSDQSAPSDGSAEVQTDTVPVVEFTDPAGDGTSDTTFVVDNPVVEEPEPVIVEPTAEPTAEPALEPTAEPVSEPTPEPVIEEPQGPFWEGIDEDQVAILQSVFSEMTPLGKVYSGWFGGSDYAPCTWNGITCEDGRVTGLEFTNAGFFTVFPESILELQDLKSLVMTDTLVRGPLPEKFFMALQKLELLELKGNLLTGTIPSLPDAFLYYPMLQKIIISDNLMDERKTQLLSLPEYADVAYYDLDPYMFPEVDPEPGLDGEIPQDWNRLPVLSEIDLSGNRLSGMVPDAFLYLPLTKLDLNDNAELFRISDILYNALVGLDSPEIKLDGIQSPEAVVSEPVEDQPEPVVSEPVEVQPEASVTSEFQITEPIYNDYSNDSQPEEQAPQSVEILVDYIPPVDIWSDSPEENQADPNYYSSDPEVVYVVVTATPEPQYYTSTPVPYYPQQPYIYPTATPYYYQQPVYTYPTATPYYYQQPVYVYPTATPYTNYNPNWVYPTATAYYPQYVQNQQSPTTVPTLSPTQNPASLLGFTYKLEAMTDKNIPMTWRYTGMKEYSINYLDANGNIYPGFAMEWTSASELCNASVCNATVTVPDELLGQGKFSLELRVHDAAGNTYVSEPVAMEVSVQNPTPTPVPEQPKSFFAGFFEWLFGPLIRLFGGK